MGKLLILIIALALIVGCTRDYECETKWLNTETGETRTDGEANMTYMTTWPGNEKDAKETCELSFKGQESSNVNAEYDGTFHSCSCFKAN